MIVYVVIGIYNGALGDIKGFSDRKKAQNFEDELYRQHPYAKGREINFYSFGV